MRKHISKILAFALLPLLWLLFPGDIQSPLVDTCDSWNYHDFHSFVGHRTAVVFAVKSLLQISGIDSNYEAGLWLNISFFILGMIGLLKLVRMFSRNNGINYWLLLIAVMSSPLIVLMNQKVQTDYYATVLCLYAFIHLYQIKYRSEANQNLLKSIYAGALLALAYNIKETTVLFVLVFGVIVLIDNRKKLAGTIRTFIPSLLSFIVFFSFNFIIDFLLYDNAFYRFELLSGPRPQGGSGWEFDGADRSIPVGISLFHLFAHLKLLGREGLVGLLSIPAALLLYQKMPSKMVIAGLALFTVLGFSGRFTMERYWFLFLPFEIWLVYELIQKLLAEKIKGIKFVLALLLPLGVAISAYNYIWRYHQQFIYQFIKPENEKVLFSANVIADFSLF